MTSIPLLMCDVDVLYTCQWLTAELCSCGTNARKTNYQITADAQPLIADRLQRYLSMRCPLDQHPDLLR